MSILSTKILERNKSVPFLPNATHEIFPCHITKQVTWKDKNGQPIGSHSKQRIYYKKDPKTSTLVIKKPPLNDGGKYTISLENKYGSKDAHYDVIVKGLYF